MDFPFSIPPEFNIIDFIRTFENYKWGQQYAGILTFKSRCLRILIECGKYLALFGFNIFVSPFCNILDSTNFANV